jgi:hypothetical protein
VSDQESIGEKSPAAVLGEIPAESVPDMLSAQSAIEIKESCDHCSPF